MPALHLGSAPAPGHDPAADGLPWYRRAIAQGAGYFLPSVLFLLIPLYYAAGALEPWRVGLMLADTVAIAAFFLGSTVVAHWPEWARWLWLAGLMLALVAMAQITGNEAQPVYYLPFVTSSAACLIAWPVARWLLLVLVVGGVGLGAVAQEPFAIVMAIMGAGLGFSIGFGLELEHTRAALRREERRTAVLAVAAERERIGRDLHDILGHSLTTIAVKADLAQRLVSRDPAAAEAEIGDLARATRQALADVRATASGMREVRLATEIASARSVLSAAGLACEAPTALPPLDDAASELFGYVVREAVTNVVRHAGATTCRIDTGERTVSVADDGRGLGLRERSGSGLAGLRARLSDAGGVLEVESGPGGTTVRASLPEGES